MSENAVHAPSLLGVAVRGEEEMLTCVTATQNVLGRYVINRCMYLKKLKIDLEQYFLSERYVKCLQISIRSGSMV